LIKKSKVAKNIASKMMFAIMESPENDILNKRFKKIDVKMPTIPLRSKTFATFFSA
jgi:hypothetical protein